MPVVEINREAERFLRGVGGSMSPEMRAVSVTLARSVRAVLGAKAPPRLGPGITSGVRTSLRKGHKVYGGVPSAPGEPPVQQSGRLRRSVAQGAVGVSRRVAILAFYGGFQEAGVPARNLSARPFMERALAAVQDQLPDVFVRVVQGRQP